MNSRICLFIALIGSPAMAAAAACEDLEDVDARLSCLEEQYCSDTKSDAERVQCYEDIMRGLLTGSFSRGRPQGETAAEPSTVAPPPVSAPDEAATESHQAVSKSDEAVPADPSVTVVEETTIQTEKGAPEDAFGRRPEPVYQGKEPKRIGANVTSVVEQRNGRLLVALDNGQIWEENEASTKRRMIKIGSTAEVSKITFGYMMRFERGGSMRVRRLACDSTHAKRDVLSKCKRAGYEGS